MRTKNANELEPKFGVKSQNVSWYHIEKKQTMSDKVKHFDIIILNCIIVCYKMSKMMLDSCIIITWNVWKKTHKRDLCMVKITLTYWIGSFGCVITLRNFWKVINIIVILHYSRSEGAWAHFTKTRLFSILLNYSLTCLIRTWRRSKHLSNRKTTFTKKKYW